MGKVFDLNGKDLTKTDATLRVPEAPADAAAVGKRNDAQTESLKKEKSRAEGAEQKLQQQVDTLNAGGLNLKEDLIRTLVDSYLTQNPEAMGTALAEETERAKGVEGRIKESATAINNAIGQPVEFTLDGYLTGVGKYYTGNTYGKVTDYIALGSYSKVAFYRLYGNHKDDTSVNESVGIVCFYRDESEETFISSAYNYYGFASDVVTVPAEAKYVRLCKWSYVTACGKAFLCGETQKSTDRKSVV